MLSKKEKILVTGASGLIGNNLTQRLQSQGLEVLGLNSETDLRREEDTFKVFKEFKPTIVFHLAAKVGGIHANSNFKADFYSDNILINTNVVNACVLNSVRYIFAMGTGCAYPKRLENSILLEKDFLDGIPEKTNDAYAYAKRGLLVHLKSLKESDRIKYTYCLPANVYGPCDNFHPLNSHVVPGLIRRFCDSNEENKKEIIIWGDGSARRDFLYVDDCIDAMIKLSEKEFLGTVNVSSKTLTSIKTLAELIKSSTKYKGNLKYDSTKLAGQKQRYMNTEIMDKLLWSPKVQLSDGINKTVDWYLNNRKIIKER